MWPLISSLRIASACSAASSGVSANLTPPAFIRPPLSTCDLITTGPPISSAAARACSGVVQKPYLVTGMPASSTILRASYSKKPSSAGNPIHRDPGILRHRTETVWTGAMTSPGRPAQPLALVVAVLALLARPGGLRRRTVVDTQKVRNGPRPASNRSAKASARRSSRSDCPVGRQGRTGQRLRMHDRPQGRSPTPRHPRREGRPQLESLAEAADTEPRPKVTAGERQCPTWDVQRHAAASKVRAIRSPGLDRQTCDPQPEDQKGADASTQPKRRNQRGQ